MCISALQFCVQQQCIDAVKKTLKKLLFHDFTLVNSSTKEFVMRMRGIRTLEAQHTTQKI